jgi:nucleotide-binding universal stress UspA family protein
MNQDQVLRRVLVPLDGSSFAESALPVAIGMALRTGGELHVLSVLEDASSYNSDFAVAEHARIRNYLDGLTTQLREVWTGPLHTSVRGGRIAREIASTALDWRADVIVMSAHGKNGASTLGMGSIAERCVRSGFCPILLVRPSETEPLDVSNVPMPAEIVVPLDGSTLAEQALPFGAALSTVFSASLKLLRILEPVGTLTPMDNLLGSVRRLRATKRTAANAYLDSRVEALRLSGVQACSELVGESGPAEAIVLRERHDWLVITTKGRGGLGRPFFGRVAESVVRSSRNPLLLIPPNRNSPIPA